MLELHNRIMYLKPECITIPLLILYFVTIRRYDRKLFIKTRGLSFYYQFTTAIQRNSNTKKMIICSVIAH